MNENRSIGSLLLLTLTFQISGIPLINHPKRIAALTAATALVYQKAKQYQEFKKDFAYWDWKAIGTDDGENYNPDFTLHPDDLPEGMYFGASNAAIQSEGGIIDSTYNHSRHRAKYPALQGDANQSWLRWQEDLELIKKLGLNQYKFSIEWSRIQPTPDTFDMDVLKEYASRCIQLIKNGVTPFITFHHYSDPAWFMYPDGETPVGFETEENSKKFVEYCCTAFEYIDKECKKAVKNRSRAEKEQLMPRWITMNSPNAYALNGYFRGERPPQATNMQRALDVYENILNAHGAVYRAIKNSDTNAQIGISHNIFQLDPFFDENKFILSAYASWGIGYLKSWFGNWLSNSAGCRFFTDKQLTMLIPFVASKNMRPDRLLKALYNRNTVNPDERTIDFICLNYYSHNGMDSSKDPFPYPNEIKTDLPRYTIYAEGLYRAVKEVSNLVTKPLGDIPIYIVENGVAGDDNLRALLLNRSLYAVSRLYKEGYNIAGYSHWTLYDNAEWADGYDIYSFGLADKYRNIKESGLHYARLIAPFTQKKDRLQFTTTNKEQEKKPKFGRRYTPKLS
ncbi:MAG TPA: family 1 glycosylhydrolase [Candidatus Babeliales bacterium]|nr:family 1 glycosylhydrolase [Candidatus Babeliales bacterium]